MRPTETPILPAEPSTGARRSVAAAWASVDAAVGGANAEIARANLAWILAEEGRAGAARDTWRRVRLPEVQGLGPGTVTYYLGAALEETGDEGGAREAYRRAAASEATFFDHGGPAVAPAARDRLADLGVPWTD